jgi:site-specific recombinase XerD
MQREEYISVNPAAKIKPIQYTDEVKQPFSNVDLDRLRGACRTPKERAIIEILLSSGVRVSEMCALNIDDVNIHDKTVYVRHGKGDKARMTYIDDLTVMHLRHYLSIRKDDCEALLLSCRKTRLSCGGAEHIVKEIGRRAGIEKVHPHRFRRTLATTLAKRGMAIQDIQKILGHSDIDTTMVYVSVSDQKARMEYQKYTA